MRQVLLKMSRVCRPLGLEVSQYGRFTASTCRYQSHFSEVAFDKCMTGSEFSKIDQERFINNTQGPLRILGIDLDEGVPSLAHIHEQFKKRTAECDAKTMHGQKKMRDLSMAHKLLTDPTSAYYAPEKVFSDRKRSKIYIQCLPLGQQLKYRVWTWILYSLGVSFVFILLKGMLRPAMKLREKRKSLE
ncbi:hypothetical protein XU18_1993 [Perkinsela sp. CCAP 1560/4]|nr:hypothetical protein XU18_1993 [Perkinsela sp. CCAP 1560/4]|eukprot:KNH07461.1 hypothetical protein XU18_1993 [Perkinsela sp. CCAP 1560/4]